MKNLEGRSLTRKEGDGLYGTSNMAFYDGSVGSEPQGFGSNWTYYVFKDNL